MKIFVKQSINTLLTREEFKKQVFARTNGKCCVPGCNCEAADASDTIAYSKELISKETVDKWVKKKLEKYHKESK